MSTVLLTGGAGRLGREIVRIGFVGHRLLHPTRCELDISDLAATRAYFMTNAPDVVIHCAADTDLPGAQVDPRKAIVDNVISTANITLACAEIGARLVFTSTSHVFDGRRGSYEVDEPINPLGNYAKTKGASELTVRTYNRSLTIRVEFFGREFPYDIAFDDKFASKLYSDEIAPMIVRESMSDKTGVMHLEIPRRSIYEIAKVRKPSVRRASIVDYTGSTPNLIDTSLVGGLYSDRE
jgi:dTDP-4-dehydrorhamnose reductase